MFLAGLPLGTLLAIFGAAGAATVLLYVLKLRRRPVPVVFSRIWQRVLSDKESTTLFSRLKRLLSLLLQLAILAALVLALGDPQFSAPSDTARNRVVLIDTSASMKATDVEASRLGQAKQELKKVIQELGGSDRLLIATMDASVTPLSVMTSDRTELDSVVTEIEATDMRADISRALQYAADTLHGLPNPEILVISDGAFGEVGERDHQRLEGIDLKLLPIGDGRENVAITAFAVRRYPLDKSRYEVMLELTNTNKEPVNVELTLLGDGQIVDITRLSLGPEEKLSRFYPDLGGASRTLEATIKPTDGSDLLPADNHAYALMPERRRARVLVVTPGNTYLEAALLLDEYLDVELIAPAAYPPTEKFDVTIFDTVAPRRAEHTGAAIYLNPPEEGSPVELGDRIEMFGFDTWDRKSEILRWMAMPDIQVAHGHALKPAEGDHVVGASALGPLLIEGERDGLPFLALGFDPRDSDFVLRVAWPLFVLNAIDHFVSEDANYLSSYQTGRVWHVPAPAGATAGTLRKPNGDQQPVPIKDGRAVYAGELAGFYTLTAAGAESQFAANLIDHDESAIAPVKEIAGLTKASPIEVQASSGLSGDLWIYLLIGVALVSLLEWATYHRRVTI